MCGDPVFGEPTAEWDPPKANAGLIDLTLRTHQFLPAFLELPNLDTLYYSATAGTG